MAKHNRHGKAAILSAQDKMVIRHHLSTPRDKLIWDIACYTGERYGAIRQLLWVDAFKLTGEPSDKITFRSSTRKKSAGKTAVTRQVDVHPRLRKSLKEYPLPRSLWLFPSTQDLEKPVGFSVVSQALQRAIKRANLADKGITTHSPRRTFCTILHRQGIPLRTIAEITEHRSLEALKQYLEVDEVEVKSAIFLLE